MFRKGLIVALIALISLAFGFASAYALSFSTPDGAVESSGLPVDAQVTFTLGEGTISLTLQNLQANTRSVAQNISDLFFSVSGASGAFTNYTSNADLFINVKSNGTTSDVASGSTGWKLFQSDSVNFHLDDLAAGAAGPRNTIIGPADGLGIYSNANDSVAGNGPHNPFISQTATFSFFVPGVTANSVISNLLFSFGTTPGNDVDPPTNVPEPVSLLFLGAGLLGLAGLRKKFKR